MSLVGKAVECSFPEGNSNSWRICVCRVIDSRQAGLLTVLIVKEFMGGRISEVLPSNVRILAEKDNVVITSTKKYYLKDDMIHRVDGPAIEPFKYGTGSFFLYGIQFYKKEDFIDAVAMLSEEEQIDFAANIGEVLDKF